MAEKVILVEGPNDVTVIRTLIELKSGLTADQKDYLLIPAGGKDSVADLAGLLNELGVNWYAVFDWDAVDATSVPLFQVGLSPGDVSRLLADLSSLKLKLTSLPKKMTSAEKTVEAMIKELNNPPTRTSSFTGSVLEKFLRTEGLLTAAKLVQLGTAIARRQPRVIRQFLEPSRTWLWMEAIEGVVLHNNAAEDHVEALFRGKGKLSQNFSSANERTRLLTKRLKDCAHEPQLMQEVVRSLWEAGLFHRAEAKVATNFFTSN